MYDQNTWEQWLQKELLKYPKQIDANGNESQIYTGTHYLHLDQQYWLPSNIANVHSIVSQPDAFKSYEFLPFLRDVIKSPRYKHLGKDEEIADGEKKHIIKTKKRPICYASHKDAILLSYYGYSLNEIYQKYIKKIGISECVSAYRTDTKKCNIQYAKDVFDFIRKKNNCSAIAIDIKGYFDTIDHILLKEKWAKVIDSENGLPPLDYKLFKTLTSYHYINKKKLLKAVDLDLKKLKRERKRPKHLLHYVKGVNISEKFDFIKERNLLLSNKDLKRDRQFGIPQGSSMSGVLSNIYMIDFDLALNSFCKKNNFLYRRYCDDIIIVYTGEYENQILDLLNTLMSDHFLTYQSQKTELIKFISEKKRLRAYDGKKLETNGVLPLPNSDPKYYGRLQYLGFEFDGKKILIRPSSLSRYFKRMKARIVKTVKMSYSDNSKSDIIFSRKLLHRYSHLGKRNFLRYAYNASKKVYTNKDNESREGLNSNAIRNQLTNHYNILIESLNSKNWQLSSSKKSSKTVHVKKAL